MSADQTDSLYKQDELFLLKIAENNSAKKHSIITCFDMATSGNTDAEDLTTIREALLCRIKQADVSEAAKEFYLRHLPSEDTPDGGIWKCWNDTDRLLIQELAKADLILTGFAYLYVLSVSSLPSGRGSL